MLLLLRLRPPCGLVERPDCALRRDEERLPGEPGGAGDGVAAKVLDLHRLAHPNVQGGRVRYLRENQQFVI